MKAKNSLILSHGIKSICIRNLSSSLLMTRICPPNPSIEINGVIKTAENEEFVPLFRGKTSALTSNPTWNGLEFDCDAFLQYNELNEIQIRVYDNFPGNSLVDLVHELTIDIKRMVWLPSIEITTISTFPLNSIFFVIEDGGLMMDEKLYVLLRTNGLLSVASKQNRIDTNDDIDNDSQVEEQTRVKESLQKIINHKEATHLTLQQQSEKLLETSSATNSNKQIHQLQLTNLHKLKLELLFEERLLQYETSQEEAEKLQLDELSQSMEELLSECQACQQSIDNMSELIEEKKDELLKVKFILEARQLKLLGELGSTIYPIEPVPTPPNQTNDKSALTSPPNEEYMIRGIELPMVIDTSLKDDEQISTALGYVVHLLALASKYLQIPLRYEVIYNSSRSMIRDTVVGRSGPLPLFKRGVERDRFDRAISWLQKDIEQLMLIRTGATYDKRKSMLANLKQVFACDDCLKMIS